MSSGKVGWAEKAARLEGWRKMMRDNGINRL